MVTFSNSDAVQHVAGLALLQSDPDVKAALENYAELLRRLQVLMAHEHLFITTDSVRNIVLFGVDAGPERKLTLDDYILSAKFYGDRR